MYPKPESERLDGHLIVKLSLPMLHTIQVRADQECKGNRGEMTRRLLSQALTQQGEQKPQTVR